MNIFSRIDKKQAYQDEVDTSDPEDASVVINQRSVNREDILICSTAGKIYAIHKRDGSRIWRSDFPTGAMCGIVSLFVTDTDKLIVGARGRTAAMDLMTGKELWVNKMPGFGMEEVSVVTTPSRFLNSPLDHNAIESPPSYEQYPNQPGGSIVISLSRGAVMAMDIETGETLWTYNCPGGGYNIPVAIVEPTSEDQRVYVGAGKWVYCLRVTSGTVIWSSKVSHANFGCGYMTLATPWSSRLAAETHSAFSQNPSAQASAHARAQRGY
ncbi:MAG: quinon protein alcohol dehydrogenase-like superfamily [Benjaminiella poitrasii]|nr:MAG: quinon protein alcohol dehydrogenase-like superfamily [Benjaminiella poitrasii]